MPTHEHEGHRERMRARFAQGGLDGFAPHEALELLLFYAIPRRNVNPLAHRLIEHFGSVHAVLGATREALLQVPGIGEQAASLLSMVLPLAQFAQRERQGERPVVSNYKEAKDYCRHLFDDKAEEVLYLVCLDAQGRVLRAVPAIVGTIDEIVIYPRKIVSLALQHNAHAALLAHNHPSGVCEPSAADVQTTQTLRDALATVDIALMDHVIYADGECVSMAQWGQMRRIAPLTTPQAPRAADKKRARRATKNTTGADA